jgi:ArsR family transcriptional regulator, lead/cadmium/zinc/bismuth-responsive transcriptional repressor
VYKNSTCDIYCFDSEKVYETKKRIENENISEASLLFKVLADSNRAKIAYSLSHASELCVCDIANIVGITVANTSHHLRSMYKQGIVKYRKEGKLAFYSLDDNHIISILKSTIEHVNEVSLREQ